MASLKRSADEALQVDSRDDGETNHTTVPRGDPMACGKVTRASAPETQNPLNFTGPLPKLVVLDLDKTVWPIYCNEETTGPYTRDRSDRDGASVRCRSVHGKGKIVRLYPEVLEILRSLKQQGSISLAVASRSPVDEGGAARGILGALDLLGLFCCLEIHRGSKAVHFGDIREQTGLEYRDMLFFDDEKNNIKTVRRLGVTCVKLSKETGLTFSEVNSGLKQFREACLSRSSLRQWFTPVTPKKDDQDTSRASMGSTSFIDGVL